MMQGKSLLSILLMILILCTMGGLLFVQYHHFKDKVGDQAQVIKTLNQDIDDLKNQLKVHDTNQTESRAETKKRLSEYAKQIEKVTIDFKTLKQQCDKAAIDLAQCKNENEDLKKAQSELQQPIQPTTDPEAAQTSKPENSQTQPPEPEASAVAAEPESKLNELTSSETKPLEAISTDYQCPSAAIINQNIQSGQWSDPNFNWWVEFSFRPLRDDEAVKKPFQALYDGSHVDCYYRIGPKDSDEEISNTWIVIKGASTSKSIELKSEWMPCDVEGCVQKCEYQNGSGCSFELK